MENHSEQPVKVINGRATVKIYETYVYRKYEQELFRFLFYQQLKYYDIIKQIKYSPDIVFDTNTYSMTMPYYGNELLYYTHPKHNLSIEEKQIIKTQVIQFVWSLFEHNIKHGDLHSGNICWDGKQIRVIDWENVDRFECDNIIDHFDLDGITPGKSNDNRLNLFSDRPYSFINIIKPLTFDESDFR